MKEAINILRKALGHTEAWEIGTTRGGHAIWAPPSPVPPLEAGLPFGPLRPRWEDHGHRHAIQRSYTKPGEKAWAPSDHEDAAAKHSYWQDAYYKLYGAPHRNFGDTERRNFLALYHAHKGAREFHSNAALTAHLDPNNPDHWHDESSYNEHQLLNQPEHEEKGWVSLPWHRSSTAHTHRIFPPGESDSYYGGSTSGYGDPNKVKAIELRSSHYEPGRFHHIIHKNPGGTSPPRYLMPPTEKPWKITHVDTHTGKVVGESWHMDLEDAISDRDRYHSHMPTLERSEQRDRAYPPATITKIHYHDPK